MLASAALVASAACFSPPIRLIPARAPRLLLMSETAASKEAYAMLDALLKEAERGSGRGAAPARALRRRWLDLTPGELVESALILGVSIGVDFDRGLELLEVAEGETEAVPARGYSALMRLGVGAERHQEVLGLLARARAQDASSAGAILSAMQAAGALGDWGAVRTAGCNMPSTPVEGSAPAASLDRLKARAAPALPRAPAERLGSSPWPQPKVDGFPCDSLTHRSRGCRTSTRGSPSRRRAAWRRWAAPRCSPSSLATRPAPPSPPSPSRAPTASRRRLRHAHLSPTTTPTAS